MPTAALPPQAMSPLDYMLSVMRDETAEPKRRDDMAKAAAPYLHRRLSGGAEGEGEQASAHERALFELG